MMPHARLTEAEIEALRFYTWSRYVQIRIICNGMNQICKNPASNILGNGKSLQGQNIHIDLPLDYGLPEPGQVSDTRSRGLGHCGVMTP